MNAIKVFTAILAVMSSDVLELELNLDEQPDGKGVSYKASVLLNGKPIHSRETKWGVMPSAETKESFSDYVETVKQKVVSDLVNDFIGDNETLRNEYDHMMGVANNPDMPKYRFDFGYPVPGNERIVQINMESTIRPFKKDLAESMRKLLEDYCNVEQA